jgi:8-oxo-dGTP pyrophosphatase MutT (NUDIX family)
MSSEPSDKARPETPVTPRHAASLVLLRDGVDGLEVLMGRRPLTARFMPGVYVFPGGGVEADDFRFRSSRPLPGHVTARLTRKAEPALAHALAWAALRETWEETGLMFGCPGAAEGAVDCEALSAFTASGLTPDLAGLDYLMRAVTPRYAPIRFNTRFFIADGAAVAGSIKQLTELEVVGWRLIDEALDLKIVNVTEIVLEQAQRYWQAKPPPDPARTTLMFTQHNPDEVILREE